MTQVNFRSLIAVYLALCILFGGASNAGFLANAALQILGAGLLVAAAWSIPQQSDGGTDWLGRIAWLICGITLLQFVPLPFSIWEALPGRSQISSELASLGSRPKPTLVTLSLHESIASLVWAIPAIAVFVALRRSVEGWERLASLAILASSLIALMIGLVQVFAGRESWAYFYEITNTTVVGVFANANHMAALLLVTIPFLTAVFREQLNSRKATGIELGLLAALCAILIAIGIALAGSFTGYSLIIPVVAASSVILFPLARRWHSWLFLAGLGLGAAVFALVGPGQLSFGTNAPRPRVGREVLFERTWQAIGDFFPSGTGLGTFQEIYARYESTDEIDRTYANHAHSDYLEIALELGLPGVLILSVFLIWWSAKAIAIWSNDNSSPFAQAAVIASGTLLLHSAWDYPLRTAALSVVFVMACVLMSKAKNEEPGFQYERPRRQ